MSNRRQFTRIQSELSATVITAQSSDCVEVVDLSLNGMLVSSPISFVLGHSYTLKINLLSSTIVMEFEASCVHQEGCRSGFMFTSTELDALTHLRRFLELNSTDSELITQELEFLIA